MQTSRSPIQHIHFTNQYNNWNVIDCKYYRPTTNDRACKYYLSIQKTVIIDKYKQYIFTLDVDNVFFTKYYHTFIMLNIVKDASIIHNHDNVKKLQSIVINIAIPIELQKAVAQDARNTKIDKLQPFLQGVDNIIHKFIDVYTNSKI